MNLSVRIRPAPVLALAVLLWAGFRLPVHAGDRPDNLREALVGSTAQDGRNHQHAPLIAEYSADNGARFTLDRTGEYALLRFERNSEIWALRPTPAPGGDVIYKNDIGQPVLRQTRFGGLTLFTPTQPGGAPAAFLAEAPATHHASMSPATLLQAVEIQTVRLGRATGHAIAIKAEGQGGSEYLAWDTLSVVVDTILRMDTLREGRAYVDQVVGVKIHSGKKADVRFQNGIVDLTIAPQLGIAGRPSSGRIAKAIVGLR